MHYHLEVVMPPTDDVEGALYQVLEPLREEVDGERNPCGFWDWWTLGGMFSGAKLEHALGQGRIEAFRQELSDRKVTVSGVQFGKPELNPPEQREEVDRLWRERFPEGGGRCPLFADFGEQQGSAFGEDVMELAKVPRDLPAHRVIVAGPGHTGKLVAWTMIEREWFNGVSLVASGWDGTLGSALNAHEQGHRRLSGEVNEGMEPGDDWLVVTVDYHS